MPARKSTPDEPLDLDDLLGADEDVADAIVASAPEAAPAESAEERRIRELEAELAKPVPVKAERPVPESQLSEAQLRIRELEDQLARRQEQIAASTDTQYAAAGTGEKILLHFVEDGLIAQGQVWYRGQELEFEVGGEAYEQTKDKNGQSWLDLLDDIDGQYERWGKQYIKRGPWRGKRWGDISTLTDPEDIAAAQRAANAERARNRAAPLIKW